jgi:L-lactate dehydrogenase complex protein LldF
MSLATLRKRIGAAIADPRLIAAVQGATRKKVGQRLEGMKVLRDGEALRDLAADVKRHTLDHLPEYLEQFTGNVRRLGGEVHFAADAAAARTVIQQIARQHDASLCVKAKSMTTEEVHLNGALEDIGVEVWETDLGEFIVQLDKDRPSHIITPIIHKTRQQVAETMARELGCELTDDPQALTDIARRFLRDKFRRADLGVVGVNFAIAENGAFCLVTNEGNARMCMSRPRTLIALMGIEKVIPRMRDLSVLLKLVARATTGQPLGIYTSLIHGPRRADDPDGPENLHIVLLDNGRSGIWASEFREVLACIRCGACLNACPVYQNIGGHAYDSVYPGPIGSLVTPLLAGMRHGSELARASSLCGACRDACPVKIDIPNLLVKVRAANVQRQSLAKRIGMRFWRWAMLMPPAYGLGQRGLAWLARWRGRPSERGDRRWLTQLGPNNPWMLQRDLPVPNDGSFRQRWARLRWDAGDRGGHA